MKLNLAFMGDFGVANFHTVCGWLAAGMHRRTDDGSSYVVHTMGRDPDMVRYVADGSADLGVASPIAVAAMARAGRGMYDTPCPQIVALGALPHHDRLVFALTAEFADAHGISLIADIVAARPPLRLATGLATDNSAVGFAARQLLAGYGASWDSFAEWGGEVLPCGRPHPAVDHVAAGRADGILFEGIMGWHDLVESTPMRFLDVDDAVVEELREKYFFEPADLLPGDLAGVTEPVQTIDFRDWLVIVRDDMPDEVAHLLAQVMVEDRAVLEAKFRAIPPHRSALRYPIVPDDMVRTAPVPLHRGAATYFETAGIGR